MSLTTLRDRSRQPTGAEIDEIPWLAQLAPAHRQLALSSLRVVQADAGEYICRVGRPASYWFGVIDGLLKMSNVSLDGQQITYTGVPPGAWFGEGTLLKRESYRYNIEALRRTGVAGVPVEVFHDRTSKIRIVP